MEPDHVDPVGGNHMDGFLLEGEHRIRCVSEQRRQQLVPVPLIAFTNKALTGCYGCASTRGVAVVLAEAHVRLMLVFGPGVVEALDARGAINKWRNDDAADGSGRHD